MRALILASLVSLSCPAETISVSNTSITINIRFNNFESLDKQRYINATKTWLEVIESVKGRANHTLDIDVIVTDSIESDGLALVKESNVINELNIPSYGIIWMHSDTHKTDFEVESYKGTILHEIGHILGIGFTTDPFISNYIDEINGSGFCKENSLAVTTYNRINNTQFSCLPFSTNGHLYDDINSEDEPRGEHIPPMTEEVMANGNHIQAVTIALLDDIGYNINYRRMTNQMKSR
jgi:hypothetical protein